MKSSFEKSFKKIRMFDIFFIENSRKVKSNLPVGFSFSNRPNSLLKTKKSNDLFNIVGFFIGQSPIYSAICLENSVLYKFEREDFLKILKEK